MSVNKFPGDICHVEITLSHKGPADKIFIACGLAVTGVENNYPDKVVWIFGNETYMNEVLNVGSDTEMTPYIIIFEAPFPALDSFVGVEGQVPNSIDAYTHLFGWVSGDIGMEKNWHIGVYGVLEPAFSSFNYQFL